MGFLSFDIFFDRIRSRTPIQTQMDLARALGVNRSAISQAKRRDMVPQKWILQLSRHYTLSADWLEFGKESKESTIKIESKKNDHRVVFTDENTEIVQVPLISASLCAGAGSYETDVTIKDTFSFPSRFLSRLGNVTRMVFMGVQGDSMEPCIMDGDTVLIDQSQNTIQDFQMYAVGVDDSIFIKRVSVSLNKVMLLSDNIRHHPICLEGDELASFRVLGKVVWLYRDCRFL